MICEKIFHLPLQKMQIERSRQEIIKLKTVFVLSFWRGVGGSILFNVKRLVFVHCRTVDYNRHFSCATIIRTKNKFGVVFHNDNLLFRSLINSRQCSQIKIYGRQLTLPLNTYFSYSSLEFYLIQENGSLYFDCFFCILRGKEFSGSEECIAKPSREGLLETSGSSWSPFSSPSFLNPGTFVVGICSVKPCSNISLHFHDNSSLSTSEGTCLYCKQTSPGNWPVFFLYLIFHLFKGFASKRSRLQVCTFSFLTPLPFCF